MIKSRQMDHWRDRFGVVLVLLLLAVMVPTVFMFWFMLRAVENERAAVRQQLRVVYRGRLSESAKDVELLWKNRLDALIEVSALDLPPEQTFEACVRRGLAGAVICLDAMERPIYPDEDAPLDVVLPENTQIWEQAEALERKEQPGAAAALYGEIAANAKDAAIQAQALLRRARCLHNAGESEQGLEVILDLLLDDRFAAVKDGRDRLIVPNAVVMGLLWLKSSEGPAFQRLNERLRYYITNYHDLVMPASQRRFLIDAYFEAVPDAEPSAAFEAERLAARYLAGGTALPKRAVLGESKVPGVWHARVPDSRLVMLMQRADLENMLERVVDDRVGNAVLTVLEPNESLDEHGLVAAIAMGESFPDWRLALHLQGDAEFESTMDQNVAFYIWMGSLAALVIGLLAFLVARLLGRQVRITRLKNDLLATVTHELKTPLSSVRLLVDTLLEGHYLNPDLAREYLELIDKENKRLSRLIDNFLNFSRMARNKQVFEPKPMPLGDIALTALITLKEKFKVAGFEIETDIQANLSYVVVDEAAMTTVVLNLLDNAYKYSGMSKWVGLRVYEEDEHVNLVVSDRGIGLSRRDLKRVFERFYRVDRSLTDKAGGVGLGLNIVKYIVSAHGGRVTVKSKPGEGSDFIVTLPAHDSNGRAAKERTHHGK